jgi:hypothetical protein
MSQTPSEQRSQPPSPAQIEGIKLLYDFFKHLSTLSLGCIVVLATFAKTLSSLHRPDLAQAAVLAFGIAIVGCLLVGGLYALRGEVGELLPLKGDIAMVAVATLIATSVAFVWALVSLCRFAIANLGGAGTL